MPENTHTESESASSVELAKIDALLDGPETPSASEEEPEEELATKLVLGEGEDQVSFPTRGTVPQWAFFKLAVYAKQKDELGQMAAMYEVVQYIVTDEAWPDLNEYLNTHTLDIEGLMEAVSAVAEEILGRPLDVPSAS